MSELMTHDLTMSPTIGKLADAMCKAQGMMKPAIKDSNNPFFNSKYADLSAVWEAIRSPLTMHGLAVVQCPADSNGETIVLDTFLLHTSGEWMKSRLAMRPAKSDPQGIGSCLTYARRYALGAMAGVATEADDDGNAASKPSSVKTITPPMREKVIAEAKSLGEAVSQTAVAPTLADRLSGRIHEEVDVPWQKGLVTKMDKASKLTAKGQPFGTITLETIDGQEITATWFGFSSPWTYETVREQLCGRALEVEFVLTPASNPRYKPTVDHFRVVTVEELDA